MSFTFSFTGDDIEEDGASNSNSVDISDTTNSLASKFASTNIKNEGVSASIKPRSHTFTNLLQSLPSQLSYNLLEITYASFLATNDDPTKNNNAGPIRVPRRALFDIRQQLMHEVDPIVNKDATDFDDSTSNLLAGLETGDLSTGIYEGGFKTWECAIDMASYFLTDSVQFDDGSVTLRIVELGAGSAIPSLLLLTRILKERMYSQGRCQDFNKVRFTLCDYNEDVIRLCTAVNIFMVVAMSDEAQSQIIEQEGEVDIDDETVQKVLQTLKDYNIEIDFVSGGWGDDFVDLLNIAQSEKVLVVASETIYSPASLEVFTKTICDIRDKAGSTRTLIAAKKVYFGVGGGVQEFADVLLRYANAKGSSVNLEVVLDVPSAGVGRLVLEVHN